LGHPRYTKEEIVSRGKSIYDQQIWAKVEPGQIGKFLIIDIETGDYDLDDPVLSHSNGTMLYWVVAGGPPPEGKRHHEMR
jgi:hypothetical protein